MFRVACLIFATGCSYAPPSPLVAEDASPQNDASVTDSMPDADDGCRGTGLVRICLASMPGAVTLPDQRFDTDLSGMCVPFTSPTNTKACVVAGTSITLPTGELIAIGSLPLVLLSETTIEIGDGTRLDVSSARNPLRVGAGGDSDSCEDPTAATASGGSGGGGAGGSFGGRGGDGSGGANGGTGGIAVDGALPSSLRGGCPGANGAQTGSKGGPGGGAVYLIAGTQIKIGGVIDASGAAGGDQGGPNPVVNSGGGGGGSGGLIGLDAPMITIAGSGAVFANGGGGAEGQSTLVGDSGNESNGPTDVAIGGNGVSQAGNGGSGSAGVTLTGGNGTSASSGDGGGGGGGGAGVILIFPSQTVGSSVAPPPS